MESIESNKPPLPGITLPESFSLADLFKRDSTKSPKMDAIATDSPSRICIIKDALKSSGHIREETVAVRTEPKMPPAKPTKLLLGLTFT